MMNEPEITLFGTKIVFSDESESLDVSREEEADDGELTMKLQITQEEEQEAEEISETKPQEGLTPGEADESQNTANAKPEESHNTIDEEEDVAMTEGDPTNPQQQKALKKPDKILSCPRCKSMDTKFCYYNNYNVNQPRHFCKACQRYWTAGGTMRNVPVGAGRRKSKNCRQLTISEVLHEDNIDARNGFEHGVFKTNGTVLSFGPNSESMASVLNPSGQKLSNWVRNGCFDRRNGENKDDVSLGYSTTASNLVENGGRNGLQHPTFQNMNVVPWPYPWNPAVPMPAVFPGPGYPMPFFPALCGMPNAWTNSPWLSPTSSPNSPLGKHSRSGELINAKKNSESSIVVPKTLRIDDPEEAAKSSIWSTLGIKYDSRSRGGLFKSLQPKVDEKKATVTAPASPALTANPAALSRSVSFRERA